jgi:thymidine kinase
VIGIDEAQFFDEYLVDFVHNLVEEQRKYVIVVGLDGDFKRQRFGHILDLIPFADNVAKLHAYCKRCAETKKTLTAALFSHYTSGTPNVVEDAVIVGGSDLFQAVCRSCYRELTDEGATLPSTL